MPQELPTGAEALLLALATPSPQGLVGIPVLLWGRPGVGKSSFIEGLATDDFPVTTLIASIHDPTDFSGLPVLENGRVHYAVPRWVDDFATAAAGVLFLDELSTAPPSVQSALLRVVFERKVGFHALSDGVRIVAAANPPDLMVGGWELSPPLRNRFVHLDWDVPTEVYLRALSQGWRSGELPVIDATDHARELERFRLQIAGYLRLNPNALHADPEQNRYGFASPRSWDFALALLAAAAVTDADATVRYELLKGCLGEATAITLVEYLNNLRLPDPEAVLAGTDTLTVSELDDSELYVLFGGLNAVLRRETSSERFLPYSRNYLRLAAETFADERRDVIFPALRELAKEGWLVELAGTGDAAATSQIFELFSDTGLVEFVEVLG